MTRDLRTDIDAGLDLLAKTDASPFNREMEEAADLVEYGIALCEMSDNLASEPVRTIHNLSCTGGTLFAKCLASMPNTLVLNEINLHSRMQFDEQEKSKFTPTDMTALLRQGDPTTGDELIDEIFLENVRILRETCWREGRILILRDHSHSQFLFGKLDKKLKTMRELLATAFPVRSVVTTRKPADTFTSMQRHDWHKMFKPSTFREYRRRVDTFLASYSDVPVIQYEDFVETPRDVMRTLCSILDLDMYDDFEDVFSSFRFSGDSGRGGDRIVKHQPSSETPE